MGAESELQNLALHAGAKHVILEEHPTKPEQQIHLN